LSEDQGLNAVPSKPRLKKTARDHCCWWPKWLYSILERDEIMYVYPACLKQKSNSRAAVSNKQKRLQCPLKPFGSFGSVRYGRQTVLSHEKV